NSSSSASDVYKRQDDHMETKVPGIFALGDVRQKDLRQIANAVGEGSVAGQAAYNYYQDLQDKKN
ncbi:FAD-dependent oxidoreductase, partial [Lactobacillus crispatus]|uniref:FAD-dependent oxidoreductase n=1 Tax=Lactobacillus crispatus TaxID=47770 RepID=UPI00358DB5EC